MGLRDFLRKKDGEGHDDESNHDHHDSQPDASHTSPPPTGAPEFQFVRSESKDDIPTATAASQLSPTSNSNNNNNNTLLHAADPIPQRNRLSLDVFSSSRSRSGSVSSQASNGPEKSRRRISERLHLSRAPSSSEHVPQDLPAIVASDSAEDQWERRATMLANMTERARSNSRPPTPPSSGQHAVLPTTTAQRTASSSSPAATPPLVRKGPVSSKDVDEGIQEAIRLHEEGHLAKSTAMFAWLADPKGANNPLSQVLYGLALRHGWGCEPDVERGVTYLTAAASNAATVEQLALQAGLKKGGAYKGELVLAIFELGNSFRHGWGTAKDPVAAKQYYETAANLGDTDAMNEAAWCYVEGFGCKKDKFAAARYYRLAEKNGNKIMGNSWIWKEKYDPPGPDDAGKKKKR
ncbi:Protein DSF2 like protein [Verticillium longisporum]|uniref:Protein DSF2 like protein n=2 Tax=Verticillium longisporum TaxID=100787 RepID=A0A8I2ZBB1_VERLO|nr:Protein DSF2 like protein [Verticillium longisporum]